MVMLQGRGARLSFSGKPTLGPAGGQGSPGSPGMGPAGYGGTVGRLVDRQGVAGLSRLQWRSVRSPLAGVIGDDGCIVATLALVSG